MKGMTKRRRGMIAARMLFAGALLALLPGCSADFSREERRVIAAGEGPMRVLILGNGEDEAVLRSTSRPVNGGMLRGKTYATLRRRMLATVRNPENEGVGIAAPQVGVLRRIIAVQRFDKAGEPFEFFLNPEIIGVSGEKQAGREGCLSVPERYGDVERWQRIRIRYVDEQGEAQEEEVAGFTAVIFQHELDHLDGILYVDRIAAEQGPGEAGA